MAEVFSNWKTSKPSVFMFLNFSWKTMAFLRPFPSCSLCFLSLFSVSSFEFCFCSVGWVFCWGFGFVQVLGLVGCCGVSLGGLWFFVLVVWLFDCLFARDKTGSWGGGEGETAKERWEIKSLLQLSPHKCLSFNQCKLELLANAFLRPQYACSVWAPLPSSWYF